MPFASPSPETGHPHRRQNALPIPGRSSATATSSALLPEFRDGDACFASPTASLHARGIEAALPACTRGDLPDLAAELLDRHARGRRFLPLIGAIPFADEAAPRLWIPEQALFAPGRARRVASIAACSAVNVAPTRTVALPTPARYVDNVAHALARIEAGALDKVVMSRALTLDLCVDVPRLLAALIERNPEAYSFAMTLDDAGSGCLVGSSPELLLSKRGECIASNPLAGSIPRSPDPVEDARRAQALLHSAKDQREHAHVAEAVADTLAPWCRSLSVPTGPELRATPTMWHLSTRIDGVLRDPHTPSIALALALHPTPAVCGHPTREARALIDAIEGFPRGMFTGLVGWCDAGGDGEWAVSIRCAEIAEERATLYAGAGIVAGSDPQAELAETRAKMATMLQAMGLSHLAETLP
ncbi:MAG: isochorismate synthase [Xanthomonadaceae bacterium]|nr:isochorismate synthase [Xanthomonadaceae bacterium]